MELACLTLNTGDLGMSARSDVADKVLIRLRDIVKDGGGRVPHTDLLVHIKRKERGFATIVFSDFLTQDIFIVSVLVWEAAIADEVWRETLKHLGQTIGKDTLPNLKQPDYLPWRAVGISPTIILLDPSEVLMLSDIEKCFAWAVLDSEGLAGI